MVTITIPVDEATVRAYESASEAERERIQLLLRLWVLRQGERPARALDEVMEAMAIEAAANGLTSEILQSILDDDTDDDE
ncbi:MAG: hypothetical protein K8L91_30315 [Anaerolineae bacterium]|nr:hypothetical protein [Anaerolineae bacterium]